MLSLQWLLAVMGGGWPRGPGTGPAGSGNGCRQVLLHVFLKRLGGPYDDVLLKYNLLTFVALCCPLLTLVDLC